MALTQEIISANAELSGLTPEQIQTIVTLSQNDENSVLGTRIGEIYRQMDATIETTTGIKRNGDEKTYLYLERATKEMGEKVKSIDGLNAQILSLNKEKARLEKVIAEGGADAETKKALANAKKDLEGVTKQFVELKAEHDKTIADHAKELFGIRIDSELANATKGFTYKSEYPQNVIDVILSQALGKVKGMNPEYIDDGKGGKTLAFKNTDGQILRNANNMLQPYTAQELIEQELRTMGVLADKQQGGGGTKNPQQKQTSGIIDVSGARTQGDAVDMITKALLAQGILKGSAEFQTKMDEAWRTFNVANLPIQ